MHAYVLEKLAAAKGSWPKVAEGSGVPRRTIEKIARLEHRNPRIKSIERLARFFREQESQHIAS